MRPIEKSDVEALHRLVRTAETADGIPLATPIEEIQEQFDEPYFNPLEDGRVIEADGEIIAWGRIWHEPSGERQERAYLWGAVHPSHRRRGLGTELIQWQIERARQVLGSYAHDLPRFVRSDSFDWQTEVQSLFEREGMQAVRWDEELVRSLVEIPDPEVPDGIQIIAWDEDLSEEVRVVANTAFADHWGTTPRSPEGWEDRIRSHASRLDLSWIAMAGGQVVGYTLSSHYPSDEAVTGRLEGWVSHLGVLSDWRKKGIASSLINHSLESFRNAGFSHAMIGVDSDNPSGASRLYRGLGFEMLHRMVTHELEVGALPR